MAQGGPMNSESGDFTLVKPLGGGGSGTAYLVKHKRFGEVVFKKIEVASDIEKNRFQHESAIHENLRHPNIVHFYGVYSVRTSCGLFLEYMKYGDVSDFIKEFSVTWQWKTKIVHDVAQAMVYLHTRQPCIIHGDLKPENTLIDGEFRAKVSDFGLSCLLPVLQQSQAKISLNGTLPYIAPEYLEDPDKQKTSKFDVYGFAISVWEIYSGRRHSDDFQEPILTKYFVVDGDRPLIEDIRTQDKVPNTILELLKQCWHGLEHTRPSFEDIERILSNELIQIGEVPQAPERITEQEPFPTQIEQTSNTGRKLEIKTVEDRETFINGFKEKWLSLMTYLDSENGLLECLIFHGVLTDSEYDVLVNITPNKERNGRMIQQFIKPEINDKCKEFVDALNKNEQEHIVAYIMNSGKNQGDDRLLRDEEMEIIDNNMFGLVKLIQPYKMDFLYRLVSTNCITSTHKAKIESYKEYSKKVDELLTILKRRRYKDLRNFRQCLHNTMQNKIVELFEKSGLVAIHVKLVNRPDIDFIESALIAHMTDYVDEHNEKTLTAEQKLLIRNILEELERAGIRLLGTSTWDSMVVFFMCSSTNSLQSIKRDFKSGKLKAILENVYRVFYKLPECASYLIESISLHESPSQQSSSSSAFMRNLSSKNSGLAILNHTQFKITCGCSMVATHRYENDIGPGEIFYRWPGPVWMTLFACRSTSETRYSDMKCAKEIAMVAGGSVLGLALAPAVVVVGPVVAGAAEVAAVVDLAGAVGVPVIAGLSLAGIISFGRKMGLYLPKVGQFNTQEKITSFEEAIDLAGAVGAPVIAGLSLAGIISFGMKMGLYLPKVGQFNTQEKITSFEEAIKKSKMYAASRFCYAGGNGTWLILEGGPTYKNERWTAGDFRFIKSTREQLWERGTFTEESEACYFKGDDGHLRNAVGCPRNKEYE